uniref:ILEI/PANDER domain-containing protein n=1 Tax=Periophthalmus magnuspinnatus TaxID=409849 RepID=A0A3B4AVU6_9GOBI
FCLTVVVQLISLVIIILIAWILITTHPFDNYLTADDIFADHFVSANSAPKIKCDLLKDCPVGTFAVRVKSGAHTVVGPSICFDGQIVMSHISNNVGPGFNIVVVNGVTGAVDKFGYLNSKDGPEEILTYLKEIEPGRIVLLATFDDVTKKLTDEIRDVLEGMGSTLIKTLKSRDNWVFAGVAGHNLSPFEKISVNEPKNNTYGDWPEVVEISGCFPKTV